MDDHTTTTTDEALDALFAVGAHYAYGKARRHPSAIPFIFGKKSTVEIFDLEKTKRSLESACAFVRSLGERSAVILFVGTKQEARRAIEHSARRIGMPFVIHRWIGGTLTNFDKIASRAARFTELVESREGGDLSKYTKKERLLIDREIEKLESNFGGIVSMRKVPDALFIVDPRAESTAVAEARKLRIPVLALANSDCDFSLVDHVIPANDSSIKSIEYFVGAIASAYETGTRASTKSADAEKPATQEANRQPTTDNRQPTTDNRQLTGDK